MPESSWQEFLEGDAPDAPAPAGVRAYFAPLVLMLPVALGVALAIHVATRPAGEGVDTVVVDPAERERVAGWGGAVELPAGGVLEARLTPLHVHAGRQRLDARSLERALGLEPGAPYRLRLSWRDAAVETDALGLDTLALASDDARGWETLRRPAPPVEGEIANPLLVLLAEGPTSLGPGEVAQVVVWGPRAPAAPTLRLGGGAAVDVRLDALEFESGELPRSLALLSENPAEGRYAEAR